MKRAILYAVPVACAFVLLAQTSDAQCSTCAPQPHQVFQPVTPQTVVIQQPRRCCLFRLCDWIWGRPPATVVATVPAPQPPIAFAPPVTCGPTCTPACDACSGGVMQAPALSSRTAPQGAYAAYARAPYAPRPAVQQVNYAYAAGATNGYFAPATGQYAPASYSQPRATVQPATSYQYQYNNVQRATYQAPYQAPPAQHVQPNQSSYAPPPAVTPQDKVASNAYVPVQQAAYVAPAAQQATARATYIRPAKQQPTVLWTASGR